MSSTPTMEKTAANWRKQTAARSEQLAVGTIAGLFGVKGEVKCDPSHAGRMLFVSDQMFEARLRGGSVRNLRVESAREHQARLVVRFAGIESADDAQDLVGATLYAARSRIRLEKNEFLDDDLVGCTLYDATGRVLGRVDRVEHYPGSDMLLVNGRMVPLVDAFVKAIWIEAKRIDVDLPSGLIDEA